MSALTTTLHAHLDRPSVRALGAAAAMLLGSGAVSWGLAQLNGGPPAERASHEGAPVRFEAPPPPPPPPESKPKPRPKPPAARPPAAAPPPPSLAAPIGAGSFAMPGIEVGAIAADQGGLIGEVSASVMTADAVDTKPRALRRVQPSIPRRALAKQLGGRVVVRVFVATSGRVERARVVESEPAGLFDEAALEAARAWSFKPALYKNEPVATWHTIPFTFAVR